MIRTLAALAMLAILIPAPALATTTLTASTVGSGPYYLDRAGETYVLSQDVSVPGTAFVFAALNVTLDLNGHTVTFGTADDRHRYGVAVPPPYPHVNPVWSESDLTRWENCSGATIRNGTIAQGAAQADSCGGIFVYAASQVSISALTIRVAGADAFPILVQEGKDYLIYNNVIEDGTRVVRNRHQGRASIDLEAVLDGRLEIFGNVIHNSPQWGIRVTRRIPYVTWGRIYNNTIEPNTVVTNGYAIGAHSSLLEVYDNRIYATNGRGIHLDAVDSVRVFQNTVEVVEQPSWDEYTRVSAHGIKLEGCNHADVHHNTVISYGLVDDPQATSNGVGLSISLSPGTSNWVHDNDITARHLGGAAFDPDNYLSFATAIELVSLDEGSSIVVENNRFRSNDRFIDVGEWSAPDGQPASGSNLTFRGNTFEWDTRAARTGRSEILLGLAHFTDLVFLDSTFGPDVDFKRFTAGWPWNYCSWGTGSEVLVRTVDGSGASIAGVPIECRDVSGALARSGVTGPQGSVAVSLAAFSISTVGAGTEQVVNLTDHNPYTVTGTFVGGTGEAQVSAGSSGTSVDVTYGEGSGATPPPDGVQKLDWSFGVVTTTPAQGGDAPGAGEIRWLFNEPVLLSSLSGDGLVVTGSVSGTVPGSITSGLNGRLVVFRPTASFTPGESIVARLSGTVRSLVGHYLDGNGDGRSDAAATDDYELHLRAEAVPAN